MPPSQETGGVSIRIRKRLRRRVRRLDNLQLPRERERRKNETARIGVCFLGKFFRSKLVPTRRGVATNTHNSNWQAGGSGAGSQGGIHSWTLVLGESRQCGCNGRLV